jgi:hypothetical protein
VVCATGTTCAFAEGVSFPSASTNITPNRLWEIRSEQDKKNEGAYSLILRNRKTGVELRIFSGDRWCEVLWAAGDNKIAITDWSGSNSSEILLQNTNQRETAKPLADAAARAFLTKDELVGHCYWEALKWESRGQLRIRVFGHTDNENPGHQFAYEFIFDQDKKTAILVKKDSGPASKAEQRISADKEKTWKK